MAESRASRAPKIGAAKRSRRRILRDMGDLRERGRIVYSDPDWMPGEAEGLTRGASKLWGGIVAER